LRCHFRKAPLFDKDHRAILAKIPPILHFFILSFALPISTFLKAKTLRKAPFLKELILGLMSNNNRSLFRNFTCQTKNRERSAISKLISIPP